MENDARPKVLFPCPACGAPHVLGPDTHTFQCRACLHVTRFFYCRGCRTTFPTQHDPAEAWGMDGPDTVTCGGCGVVTRTRSLRAGRLVGARSDWSTTKKFYARFGIDFEGVVQFVGRRVLFGEILSSSGIKGLEDGWVMVSFDRDALYIHAGDGYEVPDSQIRLIEIAGRKEILETPPRDVVATLVADTLALKPTSASESILALAWGEGSLVIVNHSLRPDELSHVLEDYVARVPRRPMI